MCAYVIYACAILHDCCFELGTSTLLTWSNLRNKSFLGEKNNNKMPEKPEKLRLIKNELVVVAIKGSSTKFRRVAKYHSFD